MGKDDTMGENNLEWGDDRMAETWRPDMIRNVERKLRSIKRSWK